MIRVELAPSVVREIDRADEWWRASRGAASELFVNELSDALERLARSPLVGVPYPWGGPFEVRRLFLPGSRYHVYYSYESAHSLVKVRALWHGARGRGPALR